MVELKIGDPLILSTVRNLLSLCSVSLSDSGSVLLCDGEFASSASTVSKNGVIVIYTDDAYITSQAHADLSEIYGQKYICFEYPFSYSELVTAVYRFSGSVGTEQNITSNPCLIISLANCTASYGGNTVKLSPRETKLLISLNRRMGTAVSRETLREEVWANETEDGTNIVDVYISYLRKKLRPILGDGCIINKRNLGYMLILPRE